MTTHSDVVRGSQIDTPYGPGTVLEIHSYIDHVYTLTIAIANTDYRIKCIRPIVVGYIDLPPAD